MAQSSIMKQLLKRLEDGTAAIRARYESLANASDAAYRAKLSGLEEDYNRAVNEASAQAQINLKNNLEKMADAGYVRSGETVQATIAAGSNRAKMLAALASQKAKDKRAYESEMESARAGIVLEGEKHASDYENQISEMILAQENADREFEAAERQRAAENRIAQQTLEMNAKKNSGESGEKGIVPKKSPYDYVQEIIKQNSKYNKKKGYTVIDRRAILLSISSVVKDTRLSYQYRYEMYLYGKSLGYIK